VKALPVLHEKGVPVLQVQAVREASVVLVVGVRVGEQLLLGGGQPRQG
jgi:hypothetical protein